MKDFDVAILGGGIGGLVTGALLAKAGRRVVLVERQDTLGGYAHSFKVGDFDFCHQVQYLMGCEPGGPMPRLLERLGLSKDVTFNFMNPDGFDVVQTPETSFRIPSGSEAFRDRLAESFPGHRDGINRYFKMTDQIFRESHSYSHVLDWTDVLRAPWRHLSVIQHMRRTVGDVFDLLRLPPEVRLILSGNIGNLASGPNEASFLMMAGMQEAYARSAAYPANGMRDFIAKVAGVIESAPGCKILRGTNVRRLLARGRDIEAIVTDQGRLTAGQYLSNLDPALTYQMIDGTVRPRLAYPYSDAVVSLYLGFGGTDLRKHGFGGHNVWFHSHQDVDREFREVAKEHKYNHPWVFISNPSLLANPGSLCPVGSSSLVMLTFVNYEHIKALARQGNGAAEAAFHSIEESFLRILESHLLPKARSLITAKHLETPLDIERRLAPPMANCYGARLTPEAYNLLRVTSRTKFRNLRFANATAFYPGVMPITVGAMHLVDELLGMQAAAAA